MSEKRVWTRLKKVIRCYNNLPFFSETPSITNSCLRHCVHAFVCTTTRNCCCLLVGFSLVVLRFWVAARLTGFYICPSLHTVSQRILRLIVDLVWRCVLACALSYFSDHCRNVSYVTASRVPLYAARDELSVPLTRLAVLQSCAFSVVSPSIRNYLPLQLNS